MLSLWNLQILEEYWFGTKTKNGLLHLKITLLVKDFSLFIYHRGCMDFKWSSPINPQKLITQISYSKPKHIACKTNMVQKETNAIQVPLRQHLHTYMRYLSLQRKKCRRLYSCFCWTYKYSIMHVHSYKKEFVISWQHCTQW